MSGSHDTPRPPSASAIPDGLHPRSLIARLIQIAVVITLMVIAIDALPGLDQVGARLQGAAPVWIVALALALAEIGSCIGYLLVFRSIFCSQMPWGLSYDIAMAEQAANSLLPAGGAGGFALGIWALRQIGMPAGRIVRCTVAFFVVTSAANFFALALGRFRGLRWDPGWKRFGAPDARSCTDCSSDCATGVRDTTAGRWVGAASRTR
jgi:uncharacterized membrane protein YbhN (UPF0104 family)